MSGGRGRQPDIFRKCDALLARCGEIRKTLQWDAVEKLRDHVIDWLRSAGLPRDEWWRDLEKSEFGARRITNAGQVVGVDPQARINYLSENDADGMQLVEFVPSDEFVQHHMDGTLKIVRGLEDARRKIAEAGIRPHKKGLRKDLSDFDRTIVAILRTHPTLPQRDLCAKVDASFQRVKRPVSLPKSWKGRDPEIHSMLEAYDSPKLHRMIKSYISKLKHRGL